MALLGVVEVHEFFVNLFLSYTCRIYRAGQ